MDLPVILQMGGSNPRLAGRSVAWPRARLKYTLKCRRMAMRCALPPDLVSAGNAMLSSRVLKFIGTPEALHPEHASCWNESSGRRSSLSLKEAISWASSGPGIECGPRFLTCLRGTPVRCQTESAVHFAGGQAWVAMAARLIGLAQPYGLVLLDWECKQLPLKYKPKSP